MFKQNDIGAIYDNDEAIPAASEFSVQLQLLDILLEEPHLHFLAEVLLFGLAGLEALL